MRTRRNREIVTKIVFAGQDIRDFERLQTALSDSISVENIFFESLTTSTRIAKTFDIVCIRINLFVLVIWFECGIYQYVNMSLRILISKKARLLANIWEYRTSIGILKNANCLYHSRINLLKSAWMLFGTDVLFNLQLSVVMGLCEFVYKTSLMASDRNRNSIDLPRNMFEIVCYRLTLCRNAQSISFLICQSTSMNHEVLSSLFYLCISSLLFLSHSFTLSSVQCVHRLSLFLFLTSILVH